MSREEKIELYDKVVSLHAFAERKGATMPYTSLNGHMFSYFTKDDYLALRLPAKEREEFIAKYKTGPVEQYGVVQKEYVRVPDSLLENTTELKPYFDTGYDYVAMLKPKPSGKGKKKTDTF